MSIRVLGIDPGYDRCGWGVVEESGNRFGLVACGCLETQQDLNISQRLEKIFDGLGLLFIQYHPDAVAIEDLFFNNNTKTAIKVGQARGVIMLAAAKNGVNVFSYTPLQIKMAITGYGRAEKKQIQEMLFKILKLKDKIKQDDTADAVAGALAHCFLYKLSLKINQQK